MLAPGRNPRSVGSLLPPSVTGDTGTCGFVTCLQLPLVYTTADVPQSRLDVQQHKQPSVCPMMLQIQRLLLHKLFMHSHSHQQDLNLSLLQLPCAKWG